MIGLRILKAGKMENKKNIESEMVLVITFNGKNKLLFYHLILYQ